MINDEGTNLQTERCSLNSARFGLYQTTPFRTEGAYVSHEQYHSESLAVVHASIEAVEAAVSMSEWMGSELFSHLG